MQIVFGAFTLYALLNMQSIRDSILRYVRVRRYPEPWPFSGRRKMCASSGSKPEQIMEQVIGLVKKFDKIDAAKVTETADFQKDLSLDSLDRVELVMAFEEEFSIEIPEEKADKLTCCADVAKYIISGTVES
ncbi:hypothetical protein LWI28_001101 [Acer negundo]|uniref:Acyl carrier protein n=1 Tax=Acer negundo TaxID=4023 RepID=A0AAD5NI93_ACENE|nr:hypothetical protein LWI28_001101 [Acer negundo]KAK4839081.1 hypothetical protein QYF36_018918 [Acer negundo]